MGLYSIIHCNYPLPIVLENTADILFQTKDLKCDTMDYEITKDGKLLRYEYDYENVPPEENPYKNNPILAWMYSIKASNERKTEVAFHGEIVFYEYVEISKYKYRLLEFKATFTHGSLEKMEVIKDEFEDVTEVRKQADEIIARFTNKTRKWYYPLWLFWMNLKYRTVAKLIHWLQKIQ